MVFIGGKNIKDAKDLQDAVLALPENNNSLEYKKNTDFAKNDMEKQELYDNSPEVNPDRKGFLTDENNPECASIPNPMKLIMEAPYNRAVLHWGRILVNGLNFPNYERYAAYSIIHAIGHNSEQAIYGEHKQWNHYGGVCTEGSILEYGVNLKNLLDLNFARNTDYVRNYNTREFPILFTNSTNIYNKDFQTGMVLDKSNINAIYEGYSYEEVKNKVILEKIGFKYKILSIDFTLDETGNHSQEYLSILQVYPHLLPNQSYRYSLGVRYGLFKSKENPKLGKIYE